MKATGIVRRIDDLGRVVIPKELRRTLRIADGAALEIFTTDAGDVVFRKYSRLGALHTLASAYAETLAGLCRCGAAVADCEQVIAAAGCSLAGAALPAQAVQCLHARQRYVREADGPPLLTEAGSCVMAMVPVVHRGDAEGALLLMGEDVPTQRQLAALDTAAVLLAAQL